MKKLIKNLLQVILSVAITVSVCSCTYITDKEETNSKITAEDTGENKPITLDFSNYNIYSEFDLTQRHGAQIVREDMYLNTSDTITVNGIVYEGNYKFSGTRNELDFREYGNKSSEHDLAFSLSKSDGLLCLFINTDLNEMERYKGQEKISKDTALQKAVEIFEEQYGDPSEYEISCEELSWNSYYVTFSKMVGRYLSYPVATIEISTFNADYIKCISLSNLYIDLTDDYMISFDQEAFETKVREDLLSDEQISSVNSFEYYVNVINKIVILECNVDISYLNDAPHEKYSLYVIPSAE